MQRRERRETKEMKKDIMFGKLLKKLRKKKNITLEALCDGLCYRSFVYQIERGTVEVNKLLKDRLLARLGVEAENYESFLFYTEYKGWKERQDIVHSILYGKIEEARQRLKQYQIEYDRKQPLEYQFYVTMLVQIRKTEGTQKEELRELFQKAVLVTIPEPIERELKFRILSIEELNLLLEYVFYEEVSVQWYEQFISYIEQLSLDKLALSKIYPKTIYYFYQTWKRKGTTEKQAFGRILRLCDKAIEILQKARRMFYLWELLEAKMQLLQHWIEINANKREEIMKPWREWYETCRNWKEALEEVYAKYGVSKEMQEFCYIYVDREAHCIGDVIRIRRKMLGMTAKELSKNICSERTISRLETNRTKTQKEIVFSLFERLHMSMEFCKNDLLTENPEAKRLFGELKQANNQRECEKVDQLLEQVKSMVSLDIPENRQAMERNELINEYNKEVHKKGSLDKQVYIERLKEILGYTIPYEVAIASGEKYLTQNELSCLQNIMNRMDWTDEELEQLVQVLYDLFENQRQIEECLNMYEFVMGLIASQLGNKGEYDRSDEIEIKILKTTLMHRRLGVINSALYGLLWNDVQRKKEQHLMLEDVVIKKELQKCKYLCEVWKDNIGLEFFEEKLKKGM